MIILKSNINGILRKEKERTRKSCEQEYRKKMSVMKVHLESSYARTIRKIKNEYEEIIQDKEREIEKLRGVIERNYHRYQQVRQREKYLDSLSGEIENVIDIMVTRVQESVQPFYRTRAKISATKKLSDKSNDNMNKVLVMKK